MRKFIFLFLFFSTLTGFSQEKEFKVLWDREKLLTWEDFLAEPDMRTKYHASTSSGMSYSWSLSSSQGKDDFQFEVRSNFYPNLSWVKGGKGNDHLLAHEQLHFDISELHARKLRKAIRNYKIGKNIKQDLRDIYHDVETQRQQMQEKYDAESHHSMNEEAEEKWQKFVRAQLRKYQRYAS